MEEEKRLTHLNEKGEAHMVDVSEKKDTKRVARAEGTIKVNEEIIRQIEEGDNPKGDVLGVARIAGIMAAKKTSELIPLCHPLPLTKCSIDIEVKKEKKEIHVESLVATTGKTGVEMEALTAVSVALLSLYDMCKAVDKSMVMSEVHLISKSGGKSGDFVWKES